MVDDVLKVNTTDLLLRAEGSTCDHSAGVGEEHGRHDVAAETKSSRRR